ncbi:hypothetical protein, partial [Variovorax sp. Varisp62]|uniref:hypothetical protein n=1 Tax=Variovorax sp. Varisp62 TaxID=3243049 RepID=UPI0039B45EBC
LHTPNFPGPEAALRLNQTYIYLSQMLYGKLMAQGTYKALYEGIALQWDSASQTLALDLSTTASLLRARYDADPVQGQGMIAGFAGNLRT